MEEGAPGGSTGRCPVPGTGETQGWSPVLPLPAASPAEASQDSRTSEPVFGDLGQCGPEGIATALSTMSSSPANGPSSSLQVPGSLMGHNGLGSSWHPSGSSCT